MKTTSQYVVWSLIKQNHDIVTNEARYTATTGTVVVHTLIHIFTLELQLINEKTIY